MKKLLAQKFIWLFMILSLGAGNIFLFLPQTVQGENFYADSDVPQILPRSTWDNTPTLNALMTWLPNKDSSPSDWQPIERIIIHDTGCDLSNETCNNNQNPVATIQGIYRYHAVTHGWGDIGYNYIIDQQGRIYEGRYGGNGSRAAHVYVDRTKDNFNFGTIGISVIGNYANSQPSEAVYQSLARLIGWLAQANNLDPQGMRSSSIWNLLTSEFSSLYNGPIVVGHKDVEKGNPDPKSFDFLKIRSGAANFAQKYKNYIYQSDSSSKIYKIFAGTRQVYNSLQLYVAAGGVYDKLVVISQSQLDLFSESRFLKYPDGSLLQIQGEATVYLTEDGKKRNLNISAKEFLTLGFDFARVRQVAPGDLLSYPEGRLVKFGPENQLLSDGKKVYLIQGGKKRWIVSGELFSALKYNWSKVKVSPEELATYLESMILTYPDGTLVRAIGGSVVYLVGSGKLHQFISAEIFVNLKNSWLNIKNISAQELAYYSMGERVKYPENQLLRPNDENNVYIIFGGQPQAVDAATFKKNKYKWANVLVVSTQDFNILYRNGLLLPIMPTASPSPSVSPSDSPAPTPTVAVPSATPTPSVSPVSGVAPKIRVAIFEVLTPTVTLTANTLFNVLDKSDQIIATKNANENFIYTIDTKSTAFAKIVPQSSAGVVTIVSFEDHPAWKLSLNYNQFHGSVEIVYSAKSNKVWAVNELDLEDYLNGIAEISSTDASEYQKAMIVAARTYAQYYVQKGGKRGVDEVYILNNTTSDQLYKGYAREILAPSIVAAVNVTRGEIATYNSNPIVSAYSSGAVELQTNGTKSACSLWGGQYCQAGFEYLAGGAKDPAGTEYNYTTCGGANHCVGLSGAGARAFAKAGTKNYQEILKYYYLGTEIKKIY